MKKIDREYFAEYHAIWIDFLNTNGNKELPVITKMFSDWIEKHNFKDKNFISEKDFAKELCIWFRVNLKNAIDGGTELKTVYRIDIQIINAILSEFTPIVDIGANFNIDFCFPNPKFTYPGDSCILFFPKMLYRFLEYIQMVFKKNSENDKPTYKIDICPYHTKRNLVQCDKVYIAWQWTQRACHEHRNKWKTLIKKWEERERKKK